MSITTSVVSRARPLLGTLVTLQVREAHDRSAIPAATEQAWNIIAHIGSVMSAHRPLSDLGRMSRAKSGEVLTLDVHTVTVLRAAQYWARRSGGAFNPARAGQVLARQGERPGLRADACGLSCLEDLQFLSGHHVKMPTALSLDLGGIAKGYAADQAAQCLMQAGVSSALVNAGGDIRVLGQEAWSVDIRHARHVVRDRVLARNARMTDGAMATSATQGHDSDFVQTTVRRCPPWRSATVKAPDCMTADALTKWALQSSLLCPALKSALREHHASMWRTE